LKTILEGDTQQRQTKRGEREGEKLRWKEKRERSEGENERTNRARVWGER